MKRHGVVAIVGLCVLLAGGPIATQAETVITGGGSVVQGDIEFGIPAVVSLTSTTGDVFTVQRTNLKSIRFPEEEGGNYTVETFDGNILIGTLGGVPDVIGIRTSGGDVQSVRLGSIVEIRFDPQAVPTTGQPATPSTTPVPTVAPSASIDALVTGVVETYETRKAGIAIGLDTGMQLGFMSKNGLNIPSWTLGFNFLLLGPVWRTYFGPPAGRVEETARELATKDRSLDFEELTEAVEEEVTPFLLPYLQISTNSLIIPEIGGGVMLRLGRAIYIDLGASIDVLGLPWILVGLQIVL